MCGEMAELVEGARLEIVYGRNVIKGSNPFLSAKQKRSSQGWSFFLLNIRERAEGGLGRSSPAEPQCRMANALLSAKFKLCISHAFLRARFVVKFDKSNQPYRFKGR